MDGQQIPGFYIDTVANSRTVIPYLCSSGYYCLVLTSSSSESDTKYGQLHYDYCDGILIAYRANTTYTKIPSSYIWLIAFHPELFKDMVHEKEIEEYSFWGYTPDEALHVSQKENQILISCFNDIRKEFSQNTDQYKLGILDKHIVRLLNYTTRFYERQFITREQANEMLIQQYEALVKQYIDNGCLARKPLSSAYCAGQLHQSEAYLEDVLNFQLGHTHNCHMQLKQIEVAKERLRSSQEPLTQIVRELGFPSIQYFSFLFKKITGITPNEYRLMN
ncbi:helix-turn-helix domain-containing protein [Phocaeicola vulgatus]|uniref:helix-turn-helix domain-containing protein n=1 Tax=Phocaeicola vulgatus TaxID=821 RepID=UPI0032E3A136